MNKIPLMAGLLTLVGACDALGTSPFNGSTTDTTTTTTDTGTTSTANVPPGTTSPTPTDDIFRQEAQDATGAGYAEGFVYDSATDTFTIDGLAFDGDNTYARDNVIASLGPFAVYESDATFTDSYNSEVVTQFVHRAIYGVSTSGQSEFAIVRTGSYVGYGFGGFIYQRNGGVVLPTTGQASYTGSYAGLRTFSGDTGLEYTEADVAIAIDFEDFQNGGGVKGDVFNRRVYDLAGTDVTQDVIDAINVEFSSSLTTLPTMVFTVSPDIADANGEIAGALTSEFIADDGTTVAFEDGSYYAIVSGDDAEEIVGVIVIESAGVNSITAQETGGFIVYR